MKLLLDMNLSPKLTGMFQKKGYGAVHWSDVGNPSAPDKALIQWAEKNGYIILTHDLDFGAILAASQAQYPSVLQVRTQNVAPDNIFAILLPILQQYESYLSEGALITVDEQNHRLRILPIN